MQHYHGSIFWDHIIAGIWRLRVVFRRCRNIRQPRYLSFSKEPHQLPHQIGIYPQLYNPTFFDIGTTIYALKKLKLKHQSESCNKGCQNFCPMLQLYCMFLLYNNMNLIICFFLCLSSLTLISNSTFASELCKGLCKSVFFKAYDDTCPDQNLEDT